MSEERLPAAPRGELGEAATIKDYLQVRRTGTRQLERAGSSPKARERAAAYEVPTYIRHKPSGIDWLGDVPEHWRFGGSRVSENCGGAVEPEVEPYASMLLVAPNHIESGTGRLLARETSAEQGR